MRLDWVELAAGPVFTVPDLKVSAFPVRHAAPDCFGFLFEETPRQSLNGERLVELGVPQGEERGLLARGHDGRRGQHGAVAVLRAPRHRDVAYGGGNE